MIKIYRTIFKKEIITEFARPKNKTNKAIILCGGMPRYPSKKEIIELFCKKGFWVFSPRYRGTWESYGRFLKKSPHLDILDVLNNLSGFTELWSGKKYSIEKPEIYLLGASFGGPAAILASIDKRVKKAIALSPVIDWQADSKAEPMNKLGKFTKIAFGNAYRFSFKDWNRLKAGKLYNPIDKVDKVDGNKIWIFHAKDDDVVPYNPSKKFASLTNCKINLLKRGGHSVGNKILANKKFLREILEFLK